MYCVYCGTKLEDGFVFCPVCGEKAVKPVESNIDEKQVHKITCEEDIVEESVYADDIDETNEEGDSILLTDEEGNEIEYQLLDLIEYQGDEYVVLLKTESDDGLVEIMRYEIEGENETYYQIDNDKLLESIFEIFKSRAEDIFDFD